MWLLSFMGIWSGQRAVRIPVRTELHGMSRALISPVSFHVYVLDKIADTMEQLCPRHSDEGFQILWVL